MAVAVGVAVAVEVAVAVAVEVAVEDKHLELHPRARNIGLSLR